MLRRTTTKFTLISYVCDLEGCYDYWRRFVQNSRVLCFNGKNNDDDHHTMSLLDLNSAQHDPTQITFRPEALARGDAHFVFGGDAFDKGQGDIRLARDLISLQDRFPGRVHFVLGNRDTNKLKLRTEMDLQYRDEYILPLPYYLPPEHFFDYEQFLTTPAAKTVVAETEDERQRILLLKYLLAHRMGSAELFEFRRHELSLGFHPSLDSSLDARTTTATATTITDTQVLDSFWQMAQPNGIYAEFNRRGKLAVLLGETAFVHGSINDEALGIVPDLSMQEKPYHALSVSASAPPVNNIWKQSPNQHSAAYMARGVQEWFDALNKFKADSISEWEASPHFDKTCAAPSGSYKRGGSALFGYGHSRCIGPATVEVSTFLQKGAPAHVGFTTAMSLGMSGVTRVAVGHQPIGDTPLLISQPGLSIVMADTSYGDKRKNTKTKGPNGRGEAMVEVIFDDSQQQNEDEWSSSSSSIVHGTTSDGTKFSFSADHPMAGRRSSCGWWAVGVDLDHHHLDQKSNDNHNTNTNNQQKILARRSSNAFRSYEQQWMTRDEAAKLFGDEEMTSSEEQFPPIEGTFAPGVGRHFEVEYDPPAFFGAATKTPPVVEALDEQVPHKRKVTPAKQ